MTKLNGFAMPFIRYDLGDLCSFVSGPCTCGWSFPLIGAVVGRSGDVLRLPNGRVLSPRGLIPLVRKLADGQPFQIVQVEPERLSIRLESRELPARERVDECLDALRGLIGKAIEIEIEHGIDIEQRTGKKREFVGFEQTY